MFCMWLNKYCVLVLDVEAKKRLDDANQVKLFYIKLFLYAHISKRQFGPTVKEQVKNKFFYFIIDMHIT